MVLLFSCSECARVYNKHCAHGHLTSVIYDRVFIILFYFYHYCYDYYYIRVFFFFYHSCNRIELLNLTKRYLQL